MIPRYRAWGRDGNYPGTPSEKFEMFYDVSVVTTHQDKVQHVIADFGMYNESEYNGTEIIDYTLMQSTGLFDKNGKEIFEGDIIDYNGRNAVVKWHGSYASFVYMFVDELRSRNQEWEPLYLSYFHFQVVGNKFETPALLEVGS